ncbi:alpha-beta hydrolase superfamily lysophospholipase [Paenibacillus intestini]|uniref:Alpha/beta hydrolase n=1 Tax=Paenibacillus cucumis (ex Kampfer et al. 2016) TaxID=1776858 RepID=A0ABS7KGA2_9BACL|nr:CocE/NonD family hydrolase [Paenibacillus cucumis (ex Kampfer et al. 2016)]MBY0203173.1 alpha/beta hydrolase [Paenibacillus cucumis (ex Kampfer et al. 2016)]MDP9697821.1 alpha-beta hydrolase superfamily lysophospholipase [Paenibacillus intestini]
MKQSKLKHKKSWISLLIVTLIFGGTGLYIVAQQDYNMALQSLEIPSAQGKLTGILTLPKKGADKEKLGLVLFIHGDGPIDATHSEGYKPLWERLASLGYASLSLDKRGIGGSEGNWLDQSIDDRVVEAQQAIAWAKKQPMIDGSRIGVWGASQAGWVIPKLAGKEDLAFSILVSPAINWLKQGEYNTRSQMAKDGHTQQEIEAQVKYDNQIKDILKHHGSYEEYTKHIRKDEEPMSRERWSFVSKNFNSDATVSLHNFKTPVLLLLGEDDVNVDIQDTEGTYRKEIHPSSLLHVKTFQHTEHSMLPTSIAGSEWKMGLRFLFAPRSITTEGYMDEIEAFLTKVAI